MSLTKPEPLTDEEFEKLWKKNIDGSPLGWYRVNVPGLLQTIRELKDEVEQIYMDAAGPSM